MMRGTRIKILPLVALAALGLLLVNGMARALDPPAAPPQAEAQDLSWFSGCWQLEGADPGSGETWTTPAGGTLLGVGRTVREGRTVGWEQLRVEERRQGDSVTLVYIAVPSGQREAEFHLTVLEPDRVVFENPTHDFPQRLVYQTVAPDRLRVRAEVLAPTPGEGAEDGEPRGFTVNFLRMTCPGGADVSAATGPCQVVDCWYPSSAPEAGGIIAGTACACVMEDGRARLEPGFLERVDFSGGEDLAPVYLSNDGAGQGSGAGRTVLYVHREGMVAPALWVDNGPDYFVEGLARTEVGGRVGFMDSRLRVVIQPTWDFARPFENGFAAVCRGCRHVKDGEHTALEGGLWGLIDRDGAVVVPVTLDEPPVVENEG